MNIKQTGKCAAKKTKVIQKLFPNNVVIFAEIIITYTDY